jgi:hypothetical protein
LRILISILFLYTIARWGKWIRLALQIYHNCSIIKDLIFQLVFPTTTSIWTSFDSLVIMGVVLFGHHKSSAYTFNQRDCIIWDSESTPLSSSQMLLSKLPWWTFPTPQLCFLCLDIWYHPQLRE